MFIEASLPSQHGGVMCQQHILLHIYRNLLICTQADILLCLLRHCVSLNDRLRMSCCHSAGTGGTKKLLTFIDLSSPSHGLLGTDKKAAKQLFIYTEEMFFFFSTRKCCAYWCDDLSMYVLGP